MGAYLSEPICEKDTEAGSDKRFQYGATSMQGWRVNQEDAHNCILNFAENCSLFAVYDGHGGAEVSQYAASRFPDFLKKMAGWNEGRVGQALEDAFLQFDELLTRNDVLQELKVLAGVNNDDTGDGAEDVEEDKALLYEEAGLPLDDVLLKYGLTLAAEKGLFAGGQLKRITPKLRVKPEKKRTVVESAVAEDGNGPPTPPSSPDMRSNAGATAGEVNKNEVSSTGDDISLPVSTTGDENGQPTENECVEHGSKSRNATKRKWNVVSSSSATGREEETKVHSEKMDTKNDPKIPGNVNGFSEGEREKKAPVSSDELPSVKRSKEDASDENERLRRTAAADSTVGDETPGENGNVLVNGDQRPNCQMNSDEGASSVVDTTENVADSARGAKEATVSSTSNAVTSTVEGAKTEDQCGGDSAMIEVDESVSSAIKTKSKKGGGSGNKNITMDESSGASEDDEDEDYKMEVEDEESSDTSSDEIEEDEVTDEQDEMGVDEEEDGEEDDEMYAVPTGETPGVDSGTTACVAVIHNSNIYVANAGDSRCILCRGGTAVDLSFDHKPSDTIEKDRIEAAGGKITADGRVNGGLNLSRALGDHFYKRNDSLPLRSQMITALPDIHVESMKNEDEFLVLACDGIWNSMTSQDVVDFVRARLSKGLSPETVCEQLCDACLAPDTIGDGTGCDNMTAIVVLLNKTFRTDDAQLNNVCGTETNSVCT